MTPDTERGVMPRPRESVMILMYYIPEVITLSPAHMMISDDRTLSVAEQSVYD